MRWTHRLPSLCVLLRSYLELTRSNGYWRRLFLRIGCPASCTDLIPASLKLWIYIISMLDRRIPWPDRAFRALPIHIFQIRTRVPNWIRHMAFWSCFGSPTDLAARCKIWHETRPILVSLTSASWFPRGELAVMTRWRTNPTKCTLHHNERRWRFVTSYITSFISILNCNIKLFLLHISLL